MFRVAVFGFRFNIIWRPFYFFWRFIAGAVIVNKYPYFYLFGWLVGVVSIGKSNGSMCQFNYLLSIQLGTFPLSGPGSDIAKSSAFGEKLENTIIAKI